MPAALQHLVFAVVILGLVVNGEETFSAQPIAARKPKRRDSTANRQKPAAPDIDKLRSQIAALRAQQNDAEKKLAALRTQLKSLLEERRRRKADQAAAEKLRQSGAARLKKQQLAVKNAAVAKAKTDSALTAAKKALDKAQQDFHAAKKQSDAATKSLARAQTALKTIQDEVSAANSKLSTSSAAIEKTQSAIAAVEPSVLKQQDHLSRLSGEVLKKQKAVERALSRQGKFVSFSDQIAPIFVQRCLACHNARTAKGRLNLESYASLMKGGESGPVIDVKSPDFSTLLGLVEDGSMPKDADPLTKPQLALIRKWIQLGAPLNAGVSRDAHLAGIIPRLPQPPPPKTYRVPIPVTALAFSPEGKTLASSGYHEVLLWNPADGKLLRRISNVAERVYDLEFSPDGKTLAVAAGTPGQLGEAKLFDLASGKLLADLVRTDDSVFSVAFSPDGKWLAAAGADRAIRVYDVASHQRLVLIEDHADWVMGIAFSPDGKTLASASRDKTSKLFDLSPRKIDADAIALGAPPQQVLSGESLVTFNGHNEAVYDVAFSPDGKSVITCGADKQIRIWNRADAKPIRAIAGFGDVVFHLQVTKEGRLFSCSADRSVRIHTSADGKAVRSIGDHADWVYAVAYSPVTRMIATGSYNGEIRLVHETDGKSAARFLAAPGFRQRTAGQNKK